jgi:type II secretory pathway pseudopilin PulG
MKIIINNKKGFTILEAVMAMGVMLIVLLGAASLLSYSFRYNGVIWDQLEAQNDGRKVLQNVVDLVRRAEESNIGGFPIESATTSSLVFFANADADVDRERVRFFLSGKTLFRGITQPSGNPPRYTGTEELVELAHNVANISEKVNLFEYFDENYSGTSTSLVSPIDPVRIRMVKVSIELEKDPTRSPVPFHAESMVQIRNLKEN